MPAFRPRRAGWLTPWLVAALLIGAALAWQAMQVPAPPLTGRASAVDGDTIRLGRERIRLVGIDAPELAQDCRDHAGVDWACGIAARALMRQLLGQGDVACVPQGRDRYGRVLAHCRGGAGDLGSAMMTAGLAIADGGYAEEERQARSAQAGLWAGEFMTPALWRHTHGEGTPMLWEIVAEWLRQRFGW